jgi:ATP-dependent Clp endopeptidase proteolytic subunit ClpP
MARKTLLASAMAKIIEAREHSNAPATSIPGRIELKAKGDDAADLYIYGDIGESWWGESITAMSVVEQLNALDAAVKTINVYINSYGGSVSDGLAIYNALKRKAKAGVAVDTFVDGIGASIASLIFMAGAKRSMAANTRLMVHAPWGGLYVTGNATEVREAAAEFGELLDGFADAMANSYAAATGSPFDDMLALVTDGTDHWYNATAAKAAGFCTEVVDEAEQEEAAEKATATLVAQPAFARYFDRMPMQLAAALRPSPNPPASAGAQAAAPAANTTGATLMSDKTKTPEQEQADAIKAAVAASVLALQTRNSEINSMAAAHLGNKEVKAYIEKIIADADPSVTADNVGKHVLSLLGKTGEPLNGNAGVVAGGDHRDLTRKAMANAIEARVGTAKAEADNPFRGHTMAELARACLVNAGVNTNGMDRMAIVGAAFTHSSSDFPGLLSDTARKSALKGYEEAAEVIEQFTRPVSVPDFKPTNLAGLGAFSDLLVVPEGSEFKYGTFSEQSQMMKLVTFGRLFSVTRQAMINDDLSVFTEVPRKMGQAAKRTVASAVFALINSNPLLPDGFALFSAEHGNLLPGAAISTTSVDVMRQSFALQKDKDGNLIRVPLKTLLTPVALGGLARTVKTSQFEVSGAKNLTTPNIVKDTFDVVDDGRMDAASAAAWYGIADPNVVDGIVIGYLDGNQTPYLEEEQGFTVDGVAWKVRLDAAPAIADFRGLRKNPGA